MIPIRNIYYMLSYAFKNLKEFNYKALGTEKFNNVEDLLAAILLRGTSIQLKKGIYKTYINLNEDTFFPHGKINITKTINRNLKIKNQLNCDYDNFSTNNRFNQILKKSFNILLNKDIKINYKKQIKRILYNFSDVEELDLKNINFDIVYNKNNENYKLLIYICYLIIKSSIQDEYNGKNKLPYIIDDQELYNLYENFVREYYKQHYRKFNISRTKIKWFCDSQDKLPDMITDITIENESTILIIDTKFYTNIVSKYLGKQKYHSSNIYQIYSYVKNKQKTTYKKVVGMLLYAKTDEDIIVNNDYIMDGNIIVIKSIDLNTEFSSIEDELNNIIDYYLT